MLEILQQLFSGVCGQNLDHTWSPGGMPLPFCQRCTGLYVGACVAALLHLCLRPAPTNRWLWLNGGFLLLMIPFGFHWLPQGAALRAVTGVLFGFGLVAFLSLTFSAHVRSPAFRRCGEIVPRPPREPGTRNLPLWFMLLASLLLVPWFGAHGNVLAANTLILLAALGALVLLGLALANVALALRWLIGRIFNRPARVSA